MKGPDFNLTVGPTMASPATLNALGSQIMYHLDPAFLATFRRTSEKAASFFHTRNDMILLQGEGVVGLEGAARSLTRPGMHVLNLVQGIYGKGMGEWLTSYGAVLHEIEVAYNDAVDPDAVEAYLSAHPEIELVTVVHSETPSGTISDISRIGPIVRAHGVLTLVDALSSIGGVEFEPDTWQLDVCVSGGQKCLGGPVGVTMVSVSPQAWERMLANEHAPRFAYVSLIDWKIAWLENGTFPFTPNVTDVVGLEAALDALLAEGVENSIARHARAAAITRAGVRAMGLALWPVSDAISGNPITAVRVPDGIIHSELQAHIRERYGVMLSTGGAAGNLIHLAHMGPTATSLYPIVGLTSLGSGLRDLGATVDLGAGIEAAMTLMSASPA